MITVIWVGLAAGVIAGISPCVLPILPGVLVAGAASSGRGVRRSMIVVLSLAATFAVLTLLGSLLLTALRLPDALLHRLGLAALLLVGLGLIFAPVEHLLQRPFARLHPGAARPDGHPVLLGMALGALFVPCAGPVLAAIAIAGSTGIGAGVGVLTAAFAVGVAVPLLLFALIGSGLGRWARRNRGRLRAARTAGGVILVVLAAVLATDVLAPLQRSVPAYAQALQQRVEDGDPARQALAALHRTPTTPADVTGAAGITAAPQANGALTTCVPGAVDLANCGAAAEFVGLGSWFNTPGGTPLTLAGLRGQVVLVDFWTFACINCQRTLPSVTAWYDRYRDYGLTVVGVHTPEFTFERDAGNVADAIDRNHIHYPVAQDNTSATWRAYRNSWWPAVYLVDARGVLRHLQAGEGAYARSEQQIRALLAAARPGQTLPPPVDPAAGP